MKVGVLPRQQQHVVCGDRTPACVTAEALEVRGRRLCQAFCACQRDATEKKRAASRQPVLSRVRFCPTNLLPDHLGQRAYEVWRGVPVLSHGLLVDHLANGEPEGGFQTLMRGEKGSGQLRLACLSSVQLHRAITVESGETNARHTSRLSSSDMSAI